MNVSVPGTMSALLEACGLRTQLALRSELRLARNQCDATLVFVAILEPPRVELLEFAGDRDLLPRPLPNERPDVPHYLSLSCADGDAHDVALVGVRIGRGWPGCVLGAVDAYARPPVLAQLLENASVRVEENIVEAVATFMDAAASSPRERGAKRRRGIRDLSEE